MIRDVCALWGSVTRMHLVLVLGVFGAVPTASAQTLDWNYGELEVSRSALETLLSQYESVAESRAYSSRLRDQAAAMAGRIQERLQEGDFRVGDRIILQIAGEEERSDTAIVEPGRGIGLEGIGRISVAGVLRSELQDHLTQELGRFIRDPVIRTQSLVRLSIQGSVANPGFYVVPSTALLEDVIMLAGGPGPSADLEKVQIQRSGELVLESTQVQEAFTEGRSVDQLNLRAGDQVRVPDRATSSIWRAVGRYTLILASTVLLGVRVF